MAPLTLILSFAASGTRGQALALHPGLPQSSLTASQEPELQSGCHSQPGDTTSALSEASQHAGQGHLDTSPRKCTESQ